MPRYNLPHEIIQPNIVDFFGTLSLKFKVSSVKEWPKIYGHNGYRQGDFAILPLTSPYLCGQYIQLPQEELHVECVDLRKREIVVRTKRKHYENMDFPVGTWAVIVDTDLPVTNHFADNLCAYCTGLHGKQTEDAWLDRFYSELDHPGNKIVPNEPRGFNKSPWKWLNPYAKHSQPVWSEDKFLTPCSPWPSPDWKSNGLYDFVNLDTLQTLSGQLVHGAELDYYYQWPAHMGVAIFFSKKIPEFEFTLIEARAKMFCAGYPNARYDQKHNVANVQQKRLEGTNVVSFCAAALPYDRTPPEPRRVGRWKSKVEIEEVDNTL